MEMPTLTLTFALFDSAGVGGTVEVTIMTVVGVICKDAIRFVVELGTVGVPWTSVIAASVRRAVGMPNVRGNHGVRFGDMMLPSCC
jgi:hypothetical protein